MVIFIVNYHRHSSGSNIWGFYDSAVTNLDYAKRAVELGQKALSCVEHGWQGKYHEVFDLAKDFGLKFIFGTEAYWVKDRLAEDVPYVDKKGNAQIGKDAKNCHCVLLAKNEKGRRAITKALSQANIDGYYYRPRLDFELIFDLPPKDVLVTSACLAGWRYDNMDEIVEKFHSYFGNNYYLEVQTHITDEQKELNKHILSLSDKLGIDIIAGLDSHYIYPDDAQMRTYLMETNKQHYDDEGESNWFMDYPDVDTIKQRFIDQGVLTSSQIQRTIDNTDVCLDFQDYDYLDDGSPNPIFHTIIKLPTLYDGQHEIDGKVLPKLDQNGRNKVFTQLVSQKFAEYMKNLPQDVYGEYLDGVRNEVKTIIDTNMVDYFLDDYYIVKKAKEMGGMLTTTGRGSCSGYLLNTLLGFSQIDRFRSPITLYPERFISTTRILETKSLPD